MWVMSNVSNNVSNVDKLCIVINISKVSNVSNMSKVIDVGKVNIMSNISNLHWQDCKKNVAECNFLSNM